MRTTFSKLKPTVALLAGLALTAASCGNSTGTSAGPQLGSDTVAANQTETTPAGSAEPTEDTTGDSSTTEQTETSSKGAEPKPAESAPEPTGPVLEPLADVVAIKTLMEDLHTPTNNVSGQMQRLGPFPAMPTPSGAEITDLRVNMRDGFDDASYNYRSQVTFKADGSGEDLITFYETNLAPFGWVLSGQSQENNSFGQQILQLEYEIPEATYNLEDFKVTVVVDDNNTTVQLDYVEQIPIENRRAPERLEGWFGDAPIPDGGKLKERSLWTSSIVGTTLHLEAAWGFADVQEGEMADAVEAKLPIGGYTLGEREDKDSYWVFDLRNELFEDPQILISESDLSTGLNATVNLSAEKDFLPSS